MIKQPQKLNINCPPALLESMGYEGKCKWVAIYDDDRHKELSIYDGNHPQKADMRGWILFAAHPYFEQEIAEIIHRGELEQPCIIINRESLEILATDKRSGVEYVERSNSRRVITDPDLLDVEYERAQKPPKSRRIRESAQIAQRDRYIMQVQDWIAKKSRQIADEEIAKS